MYVSLKELHTSARTLCIHCGKDGTNACSNCKWAYYCSKKCQQANWKHHKLLCLKNCIVHLEDVRNGFQTALIKLQDKLKVISQEINKFAKRDKTRETYAHRHPAAERAFTELVDTLSSRASEAEVAEFIYNIRFEPDHKDLIANIEVIAWESVELRDFILVRTHAILHANQTDFEYDKTTKDAVTTLRKLHQETRMNIARTIVLGNATLIELGAYDVDIKEYTNSREWYKGDGQ
jgi:hypothetical protein